jgi:hypothetical protein
MKTLTEYVNSRIDELESEIVFEKLAVRKMKKEDFVSTLEFQAELEASVDNCKRLMAQVYELRILADAVMRGEVK